ncbi:MAG TPA: outer membrane lipoprotein carrier protein LolA, partial [Nitrospiria bacterium]
MDRLFKLPPCLIGRTLLAVLILIGLPSGTGKAEEVTPPLDSVIRKIQSTYESTMDWRAEFQQTMTISGFDSPVRSSGTLYIKKPGKLRWDYQEPSRDQIMVNMDTIWVFTADQKQVIVSSFDEISDSQLPLHLLMGFGKLNRDFHVEWSDPAAPLDGEAPILRLTPREPAQGITHLLVKVHPETFMITHLTLFESSGNRSRFVFSKIKKNKGL